MLYNRAMAKKEGQVNIRVSEEEKKLLEQDAKNEQRSVSN